MAGITSTDKQFKTIHTIFTIIDFIVLVFSAYRMLTINYANIYQYGRTTSIQNLPLYFFLTIASLIIFILSICILLFCKKYNAKIIFAYILFALFITVAVITGVKVPSVSEYVSSSYDYEQSEYLPIDNFRYNENSTDYYYHNVHIGDIHWIGSSSYKDFSSKNTIDNSTEDVSDSIVYMNYYYLFDESGRLIKDYSDKKNWYDILSAAYYESEEIIDDYVVYEYEDSYELILEDDSEVFYLSASKNKRTKYDKNDLVILANELKVNLQKV